MDSIIAGLFLIKWAIIIEMIIHLTHLLVFNSWNWDVEKWKNDEYDYLITKK